MRFSGCTSTFTQRLDKNLGRDASVKQLIEQFEKIKPDFVQCDCKGHPGVTAWPTDVGVRSPGIVKDALAIWREATRRLELPLIMHYSGVYDVAAIANHPDWGRIKSSRETAAAGGDSLDHDHTCPLSDYTEHYMIPQMLELIRKYDIDGFWVDGENWATQPCYCPRCRAEFTRRTGIEHAPEGDDEPHWNEWLAFTRDLFVEHVDKYAHAIHAEKPSCSVCSNWMYSVRQPDPITAAVDYISGDFSYIWSGRTALIESRFMSNRGLKWDLMAWGFSSYGPMDSWEFKSVPALCQEAAIVMSAGGAFTIYDTPQPHRQHRRVAHGRAGRRGGVLPRSPEVVPGQPVGQAGARAARARALLSHGFRRLLQYRARQHRRD